MSDYRRRGLFALVAVTATALLLALAKPRAQQAPTDETGSRDVIIRVLDPLLENQWHLKARSLEIGGTNVRAEWPTTRGSGVVIGIVDDGLQWTHPDLQPNYLSSASFDFNFNDADPSPTTSGSCSTGANCHGTAAAGVAAARDDNGIGVAGAAPQASLAGLRLIALGTTDLQQASALNYLPNTIDIASNSWGPSDDGRTLAGPGPLTYAAMQSAVTSGRNGKGRVFVWAAGNGLANSDNCNFDGYANSRFVIAVGAVTDAGAQASYSESCAALLVSAASNGGTRSITTTDLVGANGYDTIGDYTNTFGGTSSATPLVSGAVALMLARNPNLTWRDVQHILRRSSFRLNPGDSGWTAGPYPHNEKYGFGQLDAQAAADMAAAWTNVPGEATPLTPGTRTVNLVVPDNNATGISDAVAVSADPNFVVEHVEVDFTATHTYRGDLQVTLTSPAGVVSMLAPVRGGDSNDNFSAWRFGSVRHWGESAVGTWTLRVSDRAALDVGTWNSWTLRVYGYRSGTPVTITTQPQSQNIPSGQAGTLSVVGAGTAPLSYQWYLGTTGITTSPIAGATSSSYTTSTLMGTRNYWVRVSNGFGPPADSNTATLTANPPPGLLIQDTFNGTLGTLLTAHAPNMNLTGNPWTLNGGVPAPMLVPGGVGVTAGSGHLQVTIDSGVADIAMAVDYRAGSGPGMGALAFRLTDANNFLLLETFGNVLYFYKVQGGGATLLANQPLPAALVPGTTHWLEVRTLGSTLEGWWDGARLLQVTDGFQQTATRHGLDWNSAFDATSIYSNFYLRGNGTPAIPPSITIQPQGQTIASGHSATMSVAAAGAAPLTYQWYLGLSGATTTPIAGAMASSFTTASLTTAASYWVRVVNAFGTADSSTADISIGVGPAITTNPQSQTILSGQTAALTVMATGTAPLTYQWYLGASGTTTTPIAGATASSYTTSTLTSTTSYWVRVSNPYATPVNSSTATITINVAPTITTQPQSQVIASGQAGTLSVGSTGTAPLTYQWYVGTSGTTTTPIAGATASSYTTPPLTSTTSYWVRVTNSVGGADSATATVTIGVGPTITAPPQGQTINAGQTATLTVAASGTAPFTYQWYVGVTGTTTTPIAGATANTYTTPALTATQSYWVRVANGAGTDDSIVATVTVTLPPGLLVLDSFSGTPGTLLTAHTPDVNLTGHPWTLNGGAPTPTLVTAGVGVTAGPGHLQVTIDSGAPDIAMGVDYRVGTGPGLGALVFRLTDASNFLLLETYANTLYLYKCQTGGCLPLASQPLPALVPGSTHRLETRALGSTIEGWWDGVRRLQATDVFQQTATRHGLDWNSNFDVTSVYANFELNVHNSALMGPVIGSQPQSQVIASGQAATLSVAATGTAPLACQWYVGTTGTTTTPIAGATGSSYTTPPLTNTTSYWVRVSNATGTVDSATANITIGVAPIITTQPASQTISSGQTTTLTVGSTGTPPLTYQWYSGASGTTTTPIAGATTNSYATPALTATQGYWVRVTNGAGSTDSVTATVTIGVAPIITTPPHHQTIASGQTATLNVVATGVLPLTYQWYLGPSGTTTTPIAGATLGSYTTLALTSSATYWVRVSNPYGAVDSNTVTVNIGTLLTNGQCVDFSPYVGGFNADFGPHPTPAVIDRLLDTMVSQTGTDCITTYGVLNGLGYTFESAKVRGLKVTAIIWLDTDAAVNTASIAAGIQYANSYRDTITRVSCGSEVRTRNGLAVAQPIIQNCVNQLRANGVTQPITSIDTWWQWCNESLTCQQWSLANSLDWIGVNVFPWWENKFSGLYPCTTAAQAADFNVARLQQIAARYPGKPTVLTEFGWPAGPAGFTETNQFTGQQCGIASEANQRLVLEGTIANLNQLGLSGVAFEAFRESWKELHEGPIGSRWGFLSIAPTIATIADQTTSHDTAKGPLAFTVDDIDTPTASLILSASSSNTTLVPNGNIVFAGNGANRNVTVTPAPNQAGSTTITSTVSDGNLSGTSSFLLTVVGVAPVIATGPQSQVVASGQTAALSVAVTGTAPLTYQWYVGGTGTVTSPIAGATASTYLTPPLTSPTGYWVRVTNTAGTVDSASATITIGIAPAITAQPQSQTINAGQTATLSVTATGTPPLTYQWYVGASGTTTTPIAGATANSYTTPALTATGNYWVRVANGAGSVDSQTATVTVTLAPSLLVYDTFTGTAGSLLTAHLPDVNLTGSGWTLNAGSPMPTLSAGGVGVTAGPGHLQVTINGAVADVVMGTDYRVGTGPGMGALVFRFTDPDNFLLLETYLNTLYLYKRQAGVWMLLASQPLPTALAMGSTHRFEVRTLGSAIEGWWDGARLVQTTDTFQQSATRHGLDWNSAFDATSVYDNFQLSVNGPTAVAPVITLQPQSRVIASGQTTTLTVAATGTAPLTYQWYLGASGTTTAPIVGATSSSYLTPPLTSPASYWVRVSNATGNADSATATVTIGVAPTITLQPASQTINAAQTATLSVAATGTVPLSYQWYVGASGTTTTPIAGATTTSYTTPALTATQSYWVRVANGAGSADSGTATVTVNLPTGLLIQDTFTGTLGSLLTAHVPDVNVTGNPWVLNGGSPAPTLMTSGVGVTPGPGHLQVTINSGVADIAMGVDYRVGSGPGMGALVFRLSDPDNFLLLETYANTLYLYKRQVGTWVALASQALPASLVSGSTHRLEVRTLGSTLEAWWDGTRLLQTSDTFQQTATRHGLDWNSAFDATSVYDNFQLSVNGPTAAAPVITLQPQSRVIASGQTATLTVAATGTAPLTYQWYLGTSGTTTSPVVGATASSYVTPALTSPTSYWVRVSNATGTADSTTATVTIGVAPVITIQPASQTINAGQTATLSVAATGTAPLTYQWYLGASGTTATPIAGATTSSYTTPALTATQSYWVRVANGAGRTDSGTATMTLNLPTGLLIQDTFTGTAGSLLTTHTPDVNLTGNAWTLNGGSPMPTLVAGGVGVTPGPGHLQVTINSGVADIVMGADYRAGTGPGMGALVFRLTDADNFLLLETYLNTLYLYKRQGGVWMFLASQPLPAPLTMGSTHRLEVRTLGSAIEGWWDGARLVQATDAFQQTATRHGLDWNSGFDATSVYANFQLSVNGPAAPAAPAVPGAPSPANAATGISTTATLTWTAAGATTYDVSFGTSTPPPPVASNLASASYAPPPTIASTTYFWQVTARNATGTTPGPIWSYTTSSGTTPPGLLVQDTFAGTVGTLLTAHAPDVNLTGNAWTLNGGAPTPTLVAGGGVGVTAGPGHLQVTINSGVANIAMGADYRVGAGPGMGGLVFRLTDPDNFLLLETYANALHLYKRQSATWIELASQPLPAGFVMGSTHRLEVRASGSTIEGWWDGVQLLQATETFQQTATRHGFDWNSAFDATSVYANFQLSIWP